ncbi:benzoquinone reductase [Tilletiaria anomala UBC 951]|uniref:Benzoquinone reductase n=1 Tax=Tilletiaria anomala (strain ATCC 24038 / CBS 436.72 / UBC 951) TaxID=1037660 RepID=A0A066WA19_TILAU|nr:benzoquinone reductase [Tilletiaria anomala UBC 951]KDN50802.1 benzoquinone reductase [Tilletiaria anomala UBC 951]
MSGLVKRLSNLGKPKKEQQTPATSTCSTSAAAPAATPAGISTTTIALAPAPAPAAQSEPTTAAVTLPAAPTTTMSATKIAVVYHSLWGHISTLAEEVAAGLRDSGVQVEIFTFAETLSDEALGKMYANKALGEKYPHITPEKLAEFDGFLFGFGTRYGRAPAQVSAFFDRTGGLWAKGTLVGKFGGIFTSTSSQHGGQEVTALTTISYFAHHGITFVPIGYQFPELTNLTEVLGGSPWGAATISGGDGSRKVSEIELKVARGQGNYFGKTVSTFVKGKSA